MGIRYDVGQGKSRPGNFDKRAKAVPNANEAIRE